jgi:hypothetical protein
VIPLVGNVCYTRGGSADTDSNDGDGSAVKVTIFRVETRRPTGCLRVSRKNSRASASAVAAKVPPRETLASRGPPRRRRNAGAASLINRRVERDRRAIKQDHRQVCPSLLRTAVYMMKPDGEASIGRRSEVVLIASRRSTPRFEDGEAMM